MIEIIPTSNENDLEKIFQSLNKLFPSSRHPLFLDWLQGSIEDYKIGTRILFKLKTNNKVVGYILIKNLNKIVKFNALAILPGYEQNGFGEEACKKLITHLAAENTKLIFTQIRPYNNSAIKLINKLEFIKIGSIYNRKEQENNHLYYKVILNNISIEQIKEIARVVYSKHAIEWIK